MLLERKRGFYEKYVKRTLDVICALLVLILFSWLYIALAVIVRVKLGAPVLFRQPRPGMIDPETGRERIFYMYKFRTMSDERDESGNLLPDEMRLSKFGRALRASSLDEIPEAFNILRGDMSFIGPRPQLVRDMVFMDERQRMRHTAKPGLSGLAQVNGRNAITWEKRLEWDLRYIERVSFLADLRIIIQTADKVFLRRRSAPDEETEIALDYGDELLRDGKITREEYDRKQEYAKKLLKNARQTVRAL